jgi:hypothetical protein
MLHDGLLSSHANAGRTRLFHQGRDFAGGIAPHGPCGTNSMPWRSIFANTFFSRRIFIMGRGILLWLLGIPLPIVILLVLFMR